MPLEFNERVRRMPKYPVATKGKVEVVARLASNESPEGPLPEVMAAAQKALATMNRYPDPYTTALRSRLSERYDVPADHIAIGNGSCDILLAAGDALLEPGAELVYAWPSFSVYPHLVAASGATPVAIPLDAEHRHNLDAMADAVTVATRMLIVCNPNNPTSTALPVADIAALLERVPDHVCVIVDEAYCEFNLLDDPDDSIALLERFPNLVLLRTFSKVHGLAGLRVGFALCGSADFRIATNQVRQPFYANAAAQAAAIEALRHEDEVARRVEAAVAARLEFEERTRALGLSIADSQANFCWIGVGDAEDEQRILAGLHERGIQVREGQALGQAGHLRVTYGTPQENARFFAAMEELVG
jgi:histidinol-phosphate aminotransferase